MDAIFLVEVQPLRLVDNNMKNLFLVIALVVSSFASANLEDRVSNLELMQDLSWVKFGGSLESSAQYLNRDVDKSYTLLSFETLQDEVYENGDSQDYHSLTLNLDMEATPTDRLAIYARLSMSKYYSVITSNGTPSSNFSDLSGGATERDSSPFIERAFANYKINKNFIFSFGRLPTAHGPSKHLSRDSSIEGNYPSLVYAAILDGYALTYAEKFGKHDFKAKFIHMPVTIANFSGDTSLEDRNGARIDQSPDFWSILLEHEHGRTKWFNKISSMLQYLHSDNMAFFASGTVVDPNGAGNAGLLTIGSDLKVAVKRLALYNEISGVGGSNFDLGFQAMWSKAKSAGDIIQCTQSIPGGTGCTNALLLSSQVHQTQGWLTDKDTDELTGHAFVLTGKYRLPVKSMNFPKIGAEFFYASDDAYIYDAVSKTPLLMYMTHGRVYHLFYNHTFTGGLKMNLGVMQSHRDFTRQSLGLFGKKVEIDNVDTGSYLTLIANF